MPTVDYTYFRDMAWDWGPALAAAIAILVASHFIAKGVQWGVARIVDRAPGMRKHNEGAEPRETTGYQLGQLGYWLVLLIGVVGALSVLGLTEIVTPLNGLLVEVMAFVPNLIGAAVSGVLIARAVRR